MSHHPVPACPQTDTQTGNNNNASVMPRALIASALALLILGTRSHHFASAIHLPDASLAVFFLGGFYLRRWLPLLGLATLAALTDLLAIRVLGVSDFCISPAYPFLLPAYACLWLAGRQYAKLHVLRPHSLLTLTACLLAGGIAAFAFSSGSFYLLSGKTATPSFAGFLHNASLYLAPYLANACLYVTIAAVLHVAAAKLQARKTISQAA